MKVGDLQWPRRVMNGADEAGLGGPGNRGPERGWNPTDPEVGQLQGHLDEAV